MTAWSAKQEAWYENKQATVDVSLERKCLFSQRYDLIYLFESALKRNFWELNTFPLEIDSKGFLTESFGCSGTTGLQPGVTSQPTNWHSSVYWEPHNYQRLLN